MFKLSNKKGFTLVEILIVIMILGVLSTLAINGYTQYRTSTLFGLAVDDLAAQVYEMRSKSIYGIENMGAFDHIKATLENNGEVEPRVPVKPKCYGVVWEKNTEGYFDARFFEQDFNNQKQWFADKWNYLGCGAEPVEANFRPIDNADAQFRIAEISLNDSVVNKLMLRFLPPNGAFQLQADGAPILGLNDFRSLKLGAQYGLNDEPKRKSVSFDLVRSSFNTTDEESI